MKPKKISHFPFHKQGQRTLISNDPKNLLELSPLSPKLGLGLRLSSKNKKKKKVKKKKDKARRAKIKSVRNLGHQRFWLRQLVHEWMMMRKLRESNLGCYS